MTVEISIRDFTELTCTTKADYFTTYAKGIGPCVRNNKWILCSAVFDYFSKNPDGQSSVIIRLRSTSKYYSYYILLRITDLFCKYCLVIGDELIYCLLLIQEPTYTNYCNAFFLAERHSYNVDYVVHGDFMISHSFYVFSQCTCDLHAQILMRCYNCETCGHNVLNFNRNNHR